MWCAYYYEDNIRIRWLYYKFWPVLLCMPLPLQANEMVGVEARSRISPRWLRRVAQVACHGQLGTRSPVWWWLWAWCVGMARPHGRAGCRCTCYPSYFPVYLGACTQCFIWFREVLRIPTSRCLLFVACEPTEKGSELESVAKKGYFSWGVFFIVICDRR